MIFGVVKSGRCNVSTEYSSRGISCSWESKHKNRKRIINHKRKAHYGGFNLHIRLKVYRGAFPLLVQIPIVNLMIRKGLRPPSYGVFWARIIIPPSAAG